MELYQVFIFLAVFTFVSSSKLGLCPDSLRGTVAENHANPKLFYKCVDIYLVEQECPEFFTFNASTLTCDCTKSVTCEGSTINPLTLEYQDFGKEYITRIQKDVAIFLKTLRVQIKIFTDIRKILEDYMKPSVDYTTQVPNNMSKKSNLGHQQDIYYPHPYPVPNRNVHFDKYTFGLINDPRVTSQNLARLPASSLVPRVLASQHQFYPNYSPYFRNLEGFGHENVRKTKPQIQTNQFDAPKSQNFQTNENQNISPTDIPHVEYQTAASDQHQQYLEPSSSLAQSSNFQYIMAPPRKPNNALGTVGDQNRMHQGDENENSQDRNQNSQGDQNGNLQDQNKNTQGVVVGIPTSLQIISSPVEVKVPEQLPVHAEIAEDEESGPLASIPFYPGNPVVDNGGPKRKSIPLNGIARKIPDMSGWENTSPVSNGRFENLLRKSVIRLENPGFDVLTL